MTFHTGSQLRRASATILAMALALLDAGMAFGQGGDQWSRSRYTVENGLPQNNVQAMDVDRWGGLLVGTDGGLVRFDGTEFRPVGIQKPGGIQPSRVADIISLPDGASVVRDASSRQYLYKENKLSPISMEAPARRPDRHFTGSTSSMAVAVKAMDPDSVMTGKHEWPKLVRMTLLSAEQWCVRAEHEVLIYKGSELVRRIPAPHGTGGNLFQLQGNLYTVDSLGAVFQVDRVQGRCVPVYTSGFPEIEEFEEHINWNLECDAELGVAGIVSGSDFYNIRASVGGDSLHADRLSLRLPADCRVRSVKWMDGGAVIAMGSDSQGLFIFRRNDMRTVGANGVNNAYFALTPLGSDKVVTCIQGNVRTFSPWGSVTGQASLPPFDDLAIIQDRSHRYWFGRGDTLLTFDRSSGLERIVSVALRPLCFLEKDRAMWVGAEDGIYRISGDSIDKVVPISEHDLTFRPRALCFPPNESIWIATCSGVFRVDPKGGWDPVPGLEGVCARALAVVDSSVYIGTYGSGAYLYSQGKVHRIPQDDQGFLSHVHAFMPDSTGYLWMSTNQGLFRARLIDLKTWASDTTQRMYMAYYGKRAGILNPELNGGCDPAYVRTFEGWAAFPSMDGVVWFRPEEIPEAYPRDKLLLESVFLDGAERAFDGAITVPWNANDITVRVSMAYWGDPENAKLEYSVGPRTSGEWIALPEGRRVLHLGHLPSGENVLRVRKVGAEAHGDSDMLFVRFNVKMPYYRTAWFILLCLIGAGLAFYGALRINAARLRRKNLILETMVRERTAELVDANIVLRQTLEVKGMLVSIISHDIVTPLRFIARVAQGATQKLEPNANGQLSGTLQDLAQSSAKLHANAKDLLQWVKRQAGRIELRPARVNLHALVDEVLSMERERGTDRQVELRNEVPSSDHLSVDSDVLAIILKNLVTNAVTHTHDGEVVISGQRDGAEYVIAVHDNGEGMGDAVLVHALRIQKLGAVGAMNGDGERDVQGLGLLIVADLLQILGGRFHIESELGKGSTVKVIIPCGTNSASSELRNQFAELKE